jgi:hypothetical protein
MRRCAAVDVPGMGFPWTIAVETDPSDTIVVVSTRVFQAFSRGRDFALSSPGRTMLIGDRRSLSVEVSQIEGR